MDRFSHFWFKIVSLLEQIQIKLKELEDDHLKVK